MVLSPVEKPKPLEPDIDIILGILSLVKFLKRDLGKFFNPTFHEKLHRLPLNLHLLLNINPSSKLLLQNPVPISLLHSRFQPRRLHLRRNRRHGGGGSCQPCCPAAGSC